MIILHLPTSKIQVDDHIENLTETVSRLTGIHAADFYLLENGKKLSTNYYTTDCIHVVPRILGGKGGFGSMLRAIGAQIEKTTNREACRDLSGRRLRDINEEKRLKTWLSQKEEREREAQERKRKRLERLRQGPKIELEDEAYTKQRVELTENICDSVEQGLKASCSGVKRKCDKIETSSKKKSKGLLLDIDIDSDEDISSCDSEEESLDKFKPDVNNEPGSSLVKS